MDRYDGVVFDTSKRWEHSKTEYTWLPYLIEKGLENVDPRTLPILRKRLMSLEREYPEVCIAVKRIYHKGVNGMVGFENLAVLPVLLEGEGEEKTPVFLLINKNGFDSYVIPIAPVTGELQMLSNELEEVSRMPIDDSFFVSADSLNLYPQDALASSNLS